MYDISDINIFLRYIDTESIFMRLLYARQPWERLRYVHGSNLRDDCFLFFGRVASRTL